MAKRTTLESRAPGAGALARLSTCRRAGLADLEGELLLLGAQVGDLRVEGIDLVAERGDVGGLAQVEEAQAGGGRDRDQHVEMLATAPAAPTRRARPTPGLRTRARARPASNEADPGRRARSNMAMLGGAGSRAGGCPGGRRLELEGVVDLEGASCCPGSRMRIPPGAGATLAQVALAAAVHASATRLVTGASSAHG